jgi:hypothetical protein
MIRERWGSGTERQAYTESVAEGIDWWAKLSKRGGECGFDQAAHFMLRRSRGPAQPAVKSRGREYLQIICGPGNYAGV